MCIRDRWKTENEGTTFEPIFEQAASVQGGNVEVAPSDPNIIWFGTGEANIFRSSNAGVGVYKSTDAGKTWQHMGLPSTHTIARIVTVSYTHLRAHETVLDLVCR